MVEVETHLSYSLSVQQTPWRPTTELPKNPLTAKVKKKSKKLSPKKKPSSSTPEISKSTGKFVIPLLQNYATVAKADKM